MALHGTSPPINRGPGTRNRGSHFTGTVEKAGEHGNVMMLFLNVAMEMEPIKLNLVKSDVERCLHWLQPISEPGPQFTVLDL